MPNSDTTKTTEPSSNGNPETGLVSQIEYLREVLMTTNINENSEDLTENIAALIKQVDTANQVAEGVEIKLDKLLENLEDILKGLEGAQAVSYYCVIDTFPFLVFSGYQTQDATAESKGEEEKSGQPT
jgi:ABC-type transporter Mla subunit MlaD